MIKHKVEQYKSSIRVMHCSCPQAMLPNKNLNHHHHIPEEVLSPRNRIANEPIYHGNYRPANEPQREFHDQIYQFNEDQPSHTYQQSKGITYYIKSIEKTFQILY